MKGSVYTRRTRNEKGDQTNSKNGGKKREICQLHCIACHPSFAPSQRVNSSIADARNSTRFMSNDEEQKAPRASNDVFAGKSIERSPICPVILKNPYSHIALLCPPRQIFGPRFLSYHDLHFAPKKMLVQFVTTFDGDDLTRLGENRWEKE
jgi:hypothetical protein